MTEPVVAFRFENPHLSGEYSPASGRGLDDHLAEFERSYSTQPQITELIVVRTVSEDERSVPQRRTSEPIVEDPIRTGIPEFVAPPVNVDANLLERLPDDGESPGIMSSSDPVDWRPNDMVGTVYGSGATRTLLQKYIWRDGSRPDLTPTDWGLEFGIELWNKDGEVFGGRPACTDAVGDPYVNYKDRSWAKNYGWNWSVVDDPTGPPRDPTPIGAYADYNDLLDDCDRNSMTIGIRYPQLLLQHSDGAELLISIEAPAGTMPSSVVAGLVQATSDDFCRTPLGSLYSLTDCMGIYGGSWPLPDVEQARRTLNEDRHWIAPVLCWASTEKGKIPPVRRPCPGNHLGLVGWGANWAGELGVGTMDVAEPQPVQVPGGALAGSSFSALGSNNTGYTNCAIQNNQPYCWGLGGAGQLGGSTLPFRNSVTPVAVDMSGALAGREVTQIETAYSGTCAIASGQPVCWGWHVWGDVNRVPFAIDTTGVLSGKTITDIALYGDGGCVIADWAPYCWGGGSYGELGNGTNTNWEPNPVAVDMSGALAGKQVTDITAGYFHVCVIADYRAYCWGNNDGGQLGTGSTVSTNVPVAVGGPLASLDVTALGAGYYPCAIAAGAAYCWGNGSYGTLGTGETYTLTGAGSREALPTPVDATGVLAGKRVTHIGTADSHGCVLADGAPYCWGTNWDSALSDSIPDGATAWSPVAIETTGTPLENRVGIGLSIGGGSTIVAFAE